MKRPSTKEPRPGSAVPIPNSRSQVRAEGLGSAQAARRPLAGKGVPPAVPSGCCWQLHPVSCCFSSLTGLPRAQFLAAPCTMLCSLRKTKLQVLVDGESTRGLILAVLEKMALAGAPQQWDKLRKTQFPQNTGKAELAESHGPRGREIPAKAGAGHFPGSMEGREGEKGKGRGSQKAHAGHWVSWDALGAAPTSAKAGLKPPASTKLQQSHHRGSLCPPLRSTAGLGAGEGLVPAPPAARDLQQGQEGSAEPPAATGMKSSRKLLAGRRGGERKRRHFRLLLTTGLTVAPPEGRGKFLPSGDPGPLTPPEFGAGAASACLRPRCPQASSCTVPRGSALRHCL